MEQRCQSIWRCGPVLLERRPLVCDESVEFYSNKDGFCARGSPAKHGGHVLVHPRRAQSMAIPDVPNVTPVKSQSPSSCPVLPRQALRFLFLTRTPVRSAHPLRQHRGPHSPIVCISALEHEALPLAFGAVLAAAPRDPEARRSALLILVDLMRPVAPWRRGCPMSAYPANSGRIRLLGDSGWCHEWTHAPQHGAIQYLIR
jgi:hypothetical protein